MIEIRDALPSDAAELAAVYNHYILHTTTTFEETSVDAEEMLRRLRSVRGSYPWLVVQVNGILAGYAYAHAFHERSAFRHTAETSIYLHPDYTRRGLGTLLYETLLPRLDAQGCHVLIAAIALPNPASVILHEQFGFRPAGQLPEVGYKFNQWLDVGYWHRIQPDVASAQTRAIVSA